MMDRTFRFTLEKEEYREYLRYVIGRSRGMRGLRWFLMTSVPAVLLTGVLFLKIRYWLFVSCVVALAALWVLYGAAAVWKRYLRRTVAARIFPQMGIREFKEMSYRFGDRGIEFADQNRKVTISYSDIVVTAPLESEFAFCYAGGAVLIPYRVFADEEDMRQFLKEYEQNRKK